MCHNTVPSLLCWFPFMEKQIKPEEILPITSSQVALEEPCLEILDPVFISWHLAL